VDLSTYLLRSGSRQGGQIRRARPLEGQVHLEADLEQLEQIGTPGIPEVNPSEDFTEYLPKRNPSKRATPRRTIGFNLTGITAVAILIELISIWLMAML
jgi:hypothetical protein